MNIALTALSCDNLTGIGRIVRSLASEFARAGHQTSVIAQHIDSLPPGVQSHAAWKPPLSPALARLIFARQSRAVGIGARFDLIHTFGVGRGAQVVSAQSCHLAGMRARQRFSTGRVKRRGFGLFDRVALRDERALFEGPETRLIIAVSRLVKAEITSFYQVPESKIRVVPNGVHIPSGSIQLEERARRRSNFGAGEGDFLLLFVGNEFDRKGLQTAIEAVAFLGKPKLRLLVAGSDARGPYERRAGKLGVRDQIRFIGSVASSENVYGCVDALVLPTYYEPFGMVITEAMASGVPVVTSAKAGAVEELHHGTHGLYLQDPLSAEELSAQLTQLMNDSPLRERLIHNGREAALRFAWNRIAAETLAVYREVTGSSRVQN